MCVYEAPAFDTLRGDEELGLKSPGRGGLQLSRWEEMKAEAKETYGWSGNRKRGGHWRCEKKNARSTRKCMWVWDSGNKCVRSIKK